MKGLHTRAILVRFFLHARARLTCLPFWGTCASITCAGKTHENLPKVPRLLRNPALYMRGRDQIYVRLRAENHVRWRGRDPRGTLLSTYATYICRRQRAKTCKYAQSHNHTNTGVHTHYAGCQQRELAFQDVSLQKGYDSKQLRPAVQHILL